MKNILIFCFLLLSFRLLAQPSISGNANPCPNVDELYVLSFNPSGCSITWSIWDAQGPNNTLGSIFTDANNPGRVTVRWNITASGVARLRATYGGTNCPTFSSSDITVKAVGGLFPNVVAVGGFPYCATTITLSVSNVGEFRDVAAWEWSIPSAWSFQGNSNSPVITLNIPNGCASGVVSVRARGGATCPNVSQHYSNTGGITLTRVLPNIAIIPPSPNYEARCGNQEPVTFNLSGLSCGNVIWNLPTGWQTPSGQSGTVIVGGGFRV